MAAIGHVSGLRRRRARIAWLCMIPLILVNLLVIVGPAVQSIYYSFTSWDGLSSAHWVGLANYVDLVQDPQFVQGLLHNIEWTIIFLIVPMVMGLFGAYLLTMIKRGRALFRVIFFLPYVVASVVVAAIWQRLLAPHHGFASLFKINFLGDTHTALWSVAFINNWAWWGFLLVVFLAAMQGVNPSLYEAAELDGAGHWAKFVSVTLPAIRPTFMFLALMTIIWSFLVFDYIYILTQGGPAGSTDMLSTVLYRAAFSEQQAGYGAAIGVVMAVISGIVIAAFRIFQRVRRWDV